MSTKSNRPTSTVLSTRRKLGISQSKFWNRIGITQSGGSRYEGGRAMPKPVALLVALAYGNKKEREAVQKQLALQ